MVRPRIHRLLSHVLATGSMSSNRPGDGSRCKTAMEANLVDYLPPVLGQLSFSINHLKVISGHAR